VQKCSKPFSEAKLLKYHYCSHFMSVLRKNYEHLLNSTNTCKECNKNFANSHKLLQHIGSYHDKIIDILKARGYKAELPVHSSNQRATLMTKTNTGKENDSVSNVTVEVRKVVEVSGTPSGTTASRDPAESVSSSAGKKTGGDPTRLESLLKKVTGPPAAGRRKSRQSGVGDTSRCNYELECQVCDKQLGSLHQLEQHCCRHFMKELTEQFSGLMEDGLRCGLCSTVFKQRQSLLLHLGCKHGKVNDVLKQKGYAVLPAPILATTNYALQKQLLQIKKEKMDTE